jgi:hypothetical protein
MNIKPVEPIRLGGSPAYAEVPLEPEVRAAHPARPRPLGDLTDPTTDRMRQETGHDCIACPTAVRDLVATAHNALGELEACLAGTGDWDRAERKVVELRRSSDRMRRFAGQHFEALDAWKRP